MNIYQGHNADRRRQAEWNMVNKSRTFAFDDMQAIYDQMLGCGLIGSEALDRLAEELTEVERERHVGQDEARMHAGEVD